MAENVEPRPGTGEQPDVHVEQALRRALAAQADAVDPGPAPGVGELSRTATRRWPAAVAVAAGISMLAVASGVAMQPDEPPPVAAPTVTPAETLTVPPTPGPGPSHGQTTESSNAPSGVLPEPSSVVPEPSDVPEPSGVPEPSDPTTEDAPGPVTTAVVWTLREQETRDAVELRLIPERVVLSGPVARDDGPAVDVTVRAAVDHLLSMPASDPDHVNPWWWDGQSSGDEVLDVTISVDGTIVDLPAEAFDGPVGGQAAGGALAALVRTVVSNGGTSPVTLLVDGEPDGEVWGAYILDRPLEPSSQGLASGWILDPYEGQRLQAGTVTVSGTATAFEANVLWQVTDAGGDVVADGFTSAGANGEYGPFSFTVELGPGRYTVAVREPSMAGADEGPALVWEDTKTIDVVG